MPKNDSERQPEAAQPMLRGVNIARFLCDRCPFHHNTKGRDRRGRNGLGLPPVADSPSEDDGLDQRERGWLDLPGRL